MTFRIISLLALMAWSAMPVHGQQNTAERVALAAFTAAEREIIHSFFAEHGAGHGAAHGRSGKGGNKGLPPGIAMNLARGKPLPPGIAKQALPVELIDLLPAPRPGFERIHIDGRVLLVEIGTRIVHDILYDVLVQPGSKSRR